MEILSFIPSPSTSSHPLGFGPFVSSSSTFSSCSSCALVCALFGVFICLQSHLQHRGEREVVREEEERERETHIEVVEPRPLVLKAVCGSDGGGASRRCGARGQGGSRWRGKPFFLSPISGCFKFHSRVALMWNLVLRRCFSWEDFALERCVGEF